MTVRGKSGLSRKEKAKVSARDVVATMHVQVAPKLGDYLLKATAATEVISIPKAGENLFREVKKRGRPAIAAAAGSSVAESKFQAKWPCIGHLQRPTIVPYCHAIRSPTSSRQH